MIRLTKKKKLVDLVLVKSKFQIVSGRFISESYRIEPFCHLYIFSYDYPPLHGHIPTLAKIIQLRPMEGRDVLTPVLKVLA